MYKIIFSLTAHEKINCLYDLINNIKKAFVYYNITILLSITKNLNNNFDNNKYDFVKIVSVRNNDYKIWGNINLFNQHVLNMKYIFTNNIDYDFFWFVASNKMFIKIVPENFMDEYSLKIISNKNKIIDENYEKYYNNLITTKQDWHWIDMLKKDKNMLKYIYENKFIITGLQHEGLVFTPQLVLELYNEYNNNKLFKDATFKDYVMEETFMSTYIYNKYNVKNYNVFCFRYNYKLKDDNFSFNNVMNNISIHHLSIKPVNRDYNDPIRNIIRNSFNK